MTILSANLEYMFKEAGGLLEDRIRYAAKAGITHVEFFTLENRNVEAVKQALSDTGVTLHSMLVDPRIMLVLKDTHEEFLDKFKATAKLATQLGCKNLVCGSGTGAPFLPRKVSQDVVAEAIEQASDIAESYGITILLEAVNTRVDHPGVFFSRTEDTLYIAKKLGKPNVKVLYDLYHSVAEGEDVAGTLDTLDGHIGHIQVADFPGRGEPGTGTLNWPVLIKQIAATGYTGPIGVECYPSQTETPKALAYFTSIL